MVEPDVVLILRLMSSAYARPDNEERSNTRCWVERHLKVKRTARMRYLEILEMRG